MAKVGIVSLGCAKNTIDSESLLGYIAEAGHALVEEHLAEVLLVNTCTFIEDAQKESIRAILEARVGDRRVIVTGCLAQRHREELLDSMPEIDAVIGTGDLDRIAGVIDRVLGGERLCLVGDGAYREPSVKRVLASIGPSTYLRIAEGCDNPCTFCLIPQIRGPYQSRGMDEIVEEAKALAQGGIKELNLIAQDTTRYGSDRGRLELPQLLARLQEVDGLEWIRLLYAYPNTLTDSLLGAMKDLPKVLPYLDIPLQHSHPEVLKAMKRPHGEPADELVARLRSMIPGLVIRSTFIVGFPGETEEQFEHLLQFLQKSRLDHVGAFAYSPMDGTPAAAMKQWPKKLRNERRNEIMKVQQEISLSIHQQLVGTTLPMLVEGIDEKGRLVGRTHREAPEIDGTAYASAQAGVEPGDVVSLRVARVAPYDLFGEVVE
ncbi:MAG: 30S ribosomal protein S12 methylthiotransferase RimO [Bacteroidota bacterium]